MGNQIMSKTPNFQSAPDVLECAKALLVARGKSYDKPEGERSMAATVEAFNTITGLALSEQQGWLFMVVLKAVRSQQGSFKIDSYEDLVAYGALMTEAAQKEKS